MRPQLDPRAALVHHDHHIARAEPAPADARPDLLVGDLLPPNCLQCSLLSRSTKPSSVERVLAAVLSALAIGPSRSGWIEAVVPTSASVAMISSPWNTGAASAAIPSTTVVLAASRASRTDSRIGASRSRNARKT